MGPAELVIMKYSRTKALRPNLWAKFLHGNNFSGTLLSGYLNVAVDCLTFIIIMEWSSGCAFKNKCTD